VCKTMKKMAKATAKKFICLFGEGDAVV